MTYLLSLIPDYQPSFYLVIDVQMGGAKRVSGYPKLDPRCGETRPRLGPVVDLVWDGLEGWRRRLLESRGVSLARPFRGRQIPLGKRAPHTRMLQQEVFPSFLPFSNVEMFHFASSYLPRNEFDLMDTAFYFLASLDRIGQQDYIPTQEDVIRLRIPTTGNC